MNANWKKLLNIAKIIIPFVILIIVFFEGKKELTHLSIHQAVSVIKQIPNGGFYLAIIVGLLAVSTMFFYDFVMLRSVKAPVSIKKVFRISWIANSFNGIFGFGGLIGAGVRTMLYRPYIKEQGKLVKTIAWMTTAFIMGLSFLSIFGLLGILQTSFILSERPWLWPALIGFSMIAPIYIIVSKLKLGRRTFATDVNNPTLLYSIVSLVEWTSAGVVIFVILRLLGVEIDFRQALGVYVISAIAGSLSLVPGGLGSFDLIFLRGMNQYGITTETTLSALLLYRLVYYIIPFGVGLAFAAFEMSGVARKKIESRQMFVPALETTGVLVTIQRQLFTKMESWALAALSALTGVVIIFSVLFPISIERFHILRIFIPKPLIQVSFDLSLSVGILLILLAKPIYERTKQAYAMTIVVLMVGIIFNVLKGIDFEESLLLLIILAIFFMLRKRFIREQVSYTYVDGIKTGLLIFLLLYAYQYFGTWLGAHHLDFLPSYVVRPSKMVMRTTYITAILVPLSLYIAAFLRNRTGTRVPGRVASSEMLQQFLQQYGGNVLSHLGFLGDKRIFLSSDGKALLQFAVTKKRLVVLGDPIGVPSSYQAVIEEFLDESERLGYVCIFYQVERRWLGLYHDFGYNFLKLGEEAEVDLSSFSLTGKKKASLRSNLHKFEREGYVFSVHEAPHSKALLQQLKQVSDDWLQGKKEKGFSLGYFDEEYLNRSPVATLSNNKGKIVSFVSILPVYQPNKVAIDLMRYSHDAPSGVMDAMFLHLFEWAKNNGYMQFNMGMAPLSNVGISPHSFWMERVAAAVYNNIRYMYSFSGLRQFKEKYNPTWSGKYLAYRKNRSLFATMLVITRLIGNKKK
ncbi:bifunctional lysylphosphatidylglycerol flippase/synthetase MprF [Ectobacillus polymachus]|uniref:bifunctional lysylphosphatidylglycerol flippase/synthetase MprF n=1 Tax=Ectobacillus polymachus TaxID=1508806 RepID=UPI003A862FAC